jgi:hypothetical protein
VGLTHIEINSTFPASLARHSAGHAHRKAVEERDEIVRARNRQTGTPAFLSVAGALPLGQRRSERVGRLSKRDQSQLPPKGPVV